MNSKSMDIDIATKLWINFEYKICADGGANRLYDLLPSERRASYIPDYIVGDLDSLRTDVSDYYEGLGTKVLRREDQDCNDLDKSLDLAFSLHKSQSFSGSASQYSTTSTTNELKPLSVVALGAFGGRFDQEIASVHALYKWKGMIERLILMDRENIVFLLDGHGKLQGEVAANNITHRKVSENDNLLGLTQNKGKIHDILEVSSYHCIRAMKGFEGSTCGLLPLGGTVRQIWTEGLCWNLKGEELRIGKLISSSNKVVAKSPCHTDRIDGRTSSYDSSAVNKLPSTLAKLESEGMELVDVLVSSSDDVVWSWSLHWPNTHDESCST